MPIEQVGGTRSAKVAVLSKDSSSVKITRAELAGKQVIFIWFRINSDAITSKERRGQSSYFYINNAINLQITLIEISSLQALPER